MALPRSGPWIVLASFLHGFYTLGYVGYFSSQEQYLLGGLREFEADFCLGDWFTWEVGHFNFGFSGLIRMLGASGYLDQAMVAVWLVIVVVLVASVRAMTEALGGSDRAFVMAVLFLSITGRIGLGNSSTVEFYLDPQSLSFAFSILGYALMLQGRYLPSLAAAGLGGLFHINFAVVNLPILLGAGLVGARTSEDRARLLQGGAVYLLLTTPLIALVLERVDTDAGGDGLLPFLLLRSSHHFDPATYPWEHWLVVFGCLLAIGLVKLESPALARARAVMALISLSLLLAWLCFELQVFHFVIRLFLWRLAPILMVIGYAVAAVGLEEEQRLARPAALAVVAIFVGCTLIRTVSLGPFSLVLAGFLLVAVGLLRGERPKAIVAAVLVMGCVGAAAVEGKSLVPWERIILRQQVAVCDWARASTPPGSRFLIPPDLQVFRILSHRATYVNFKAASIANVRAMEEWASRLARVAGLNSYEQFQGRGLSLALDLTSRYLALSPEAIVSLMEETKCGYYLTYTRHHFPRGYALSEERVRQLAGAGLELVYGDGRHAVFRLARVSGGADNNLAPSQKF